MPTQHEYSSLSLSIPINPSPRISLLNALRCNTVAKIKDLGDIIYKMFTLLVSFIATIKDSGDIIHKMFDTIYKMFGFLVSLVALEFVIGETFFAKHYTPLVLAAVMAFFLIWIFYTLVLLDHHTTIPTLFLILVPCGIACLVSFVAFTFILPNTNCSIFILALWLFFFIFIIAFIYYQNHAFHDSEPPLVAAGGRNKSAAEQQESVVGQPATQLDIGDFDRDCGGMVDLKENRDVMMIETDAP